MKRSIFAAFAVCTLLLFVNACSNPVESEHEDEHEHELYEIHRLELVLNSEPVVILEENRFVGENDTLFVTEGEETALIQIEAFAEDDDEIHLDELGDEYSLSYDTLALNENVASFEQHDDERWAFHLHGKSEGSTTLSLWFMHGDHADLKTTGIPVHVSGAPNV